MQKPLMITIPHSGEKIPSEASWLQGLDERLVMYDVDRYVDQLYLPAIKKFKIPNVISEWHRYSGDLNRFATDVDQSTVIGSKELPGKYSRGFLWAITTKGERLMPKPVTEDVHQVLVQKYFMPFHEQIKRQVEEFRRQGHQRVFHIDAHSMPSVGTSEHRDPGEHRADLVISDQKGKSSSKEFLDLVVASYEAQGFKIALNWPYFGGRITEQYGNPSQGHETIQVEMNRKLYMDETTKKPKHELWPDVQSKIERALQGILQRLPV